MHSNLRKARFSAMSMLWKSEGIAFAEGELPGASGAEDARRSAIIASWLEEGGWGKWVISAALLAILAIAAWASYGLSIRVVASVPAWVWLLLAIGGGLVSCSAPD